MQDITCFGNSWESVGLTILVLKWGELLNKTKVVLAYYKGQTNIIYDMMGT